MIDASIIIPLYNGDKYIGKVLNFLTAFNEKYNAEIIVINDGSTDNSIDVISKYGDQICIIDLMQNRGRSFARNRGIDAANGAVLIFLDSDCLPVDESFFTLHLEFHKKNHGALMGQIIYPIELANNLYFQSKCNKTLEYGIKYVNADGLATGNVSIKKADVANVKGFDEELRLFEDVDLGLRLRSYSPDYEYCVDNQIKIIHLDDKISLLRDIKRNYFAYKYSVRKIVEKDNNNAKQLPLVVKFENNNASMNFYLNSAFLKVALSFYCNFAEKIPYKYALRLIEFLIISSAYNGYYGLNEEYFEKLDININI